MGKGVLDVVTLLRPVTSNSVFSHPWTASLLFPSLAAVHCCSRCSYLFPRRLNSLLSFFFFLLSHEMLQLLTGELLGLRREVFIVGESWSLSVEGRFSTVDLVEIITVDPLF